MSKTRIIPSEFSPPAIGCMLFERASVPDYRSGVEELQKSLSLHPHSFWRDTLCHTVSIEPLPCENPRTQDNGVGDAIILVLSHPAWIVFAHSGMEGSACRHPIKTYPTQHIGGTVLVVMMDVDPAHEDEFNRWYNDEHLPERLEIPGRQRPPLQTRGRGRHVTLPLHLGA